MGDSNIKIIVEKISNKWNLNNNTKFNLESICSLLLKELDEEDIEFILNEIIERRIKWNTN